MGEVDKRDEKEEETKEKEAESIPVIDDSDNSNTKRAKAVRILKKLGYEDGLEDALETLGDMFLVCGYRVMICLEDVLADME